MFTQIINIWNKSLSFLVNISVLLVHIISLRSLDCCLFFWFFLFFHIFLLYISRILFTCSTIIRLFHYMLDIGELVMFTFTHIKLYNKRHLRTQMHLYRCFNSLRFVVPFLNVFFSLFLTSLHPNFSFLLWYEFKVFFIVISNQTLSNVQCVQVLIEQPNI